ncbi:FKBP-type peptidyl-prolyl cis-trans isomerase [Streptomyces sp. NPDC050145]|uniref:FKBP-type peptidyl-prolyl cis-trans isomerase n=1 Tax=Streptomyces sp. NPDC050145 TaxID=3365602 RepID=UPI0037B2F46A
MDPRPVLRTGAVTVLLAAAAACAAPDPGPENVPKVTGAAGTRPVITIPDRPAPAAARLKVLRAGTGPAVKKGQVAVTDVEMRSWEGKKELLSSWGLAQPTTVSPVGERSWAEALVGRRGGSRVLMIAPAARAAGPRSAAAARIAPDDHMVLVFDLIGGYDRDQRVPVPHGSGGMPGAGGAREAKAVVDFPAGGMPKVVSWGAGPPVKLHVRTLSEGRGPVLQDRDVAVLQYAGWSWGEDRPFRSTYGDSGPSGMVLARPALLPGMYEALKGIRVGSRLQLAVPARYRPDFHRTPGGLEQPPGVPVLYVVDVLDRQDR